ncbi:FtsX-like permease family protein [Actinosynnema sp. NPDC047251]|uniref:ABC-type transporter, permease subunit n=1 Tax=Saccharothrix espanaensis (strain ATCC 51144 / DSM 44229 / JCM 9112 / NBRC 15066 / NRRL 15764) TaxID=1179773 RepID=K0K3S2_SACES|nr:ABC transporter permease [Saccharothrix espanaensis]CCH31178.1 ABC-type transporter, permease subunit [Saccharothrix espanaensis DSM 44229]
MRRTVLAGLRARVARLVLSSTAIVLGVAFVTGSLVLADAAQAGLRDAYAKAARNVDVSVTIATGAYRPDHPLDRRTVDAVRAVPGVAAAEGRESAAVPLVDPKGKAVTAVVVALPADEPLRPFDRAEGRYPGDDTEVALDVDTAAKSGYALGQRVTLLGTDDREREFTLVGTFRPAVTSGELAAGTELVVLPGALRAVAPDRGFTEVVARAEPGTDQRRLAAAVAAALDRADLAVATGEESIAALVRQTAPQSGGFTRFLTAFSVVALLVAAMVIANTFTILVSQRTRELALLRCVGAGRRQVFASVLAEAGVLGLVASALGLLGGLGVSALLQVGISSFSSRGADFTVHLPVSWRTVAVAFAVGVLVTLLAAVLPARKATRVPPIAALRTAPDEASSGRIGRARVVTAAVSAVAGVVAAVIGVRTGDQEGAVFATVASAALLGAVLVLGPLLVGPVIGALGALPRALFGVPAKLAAANAHRNPRRTAATTAALTIGLAVVTLVTSVAAAVQNSADRTVEAQFPSDYTISSAVHSRPLTDPLVDGLARLPQVAVAAPRDMVSADVGSTPAQLTAVRGDAIGTAVRPALLSGALDRLGPGELALSRELAEQTGLAVGDTVPTTSYGDERVTRELKVVAVYDKTDGLDLGLVELGTWRQLRPEATGYAEILVKLKPGVSAAQGREAVDRAAAASPLAQVESSAEARERSGEGVRRMLTFLWALVGLAMLIAVFGIANTLSLSVLERTRESALLRALGLTRGQLRGMLVVESLLMALMGALIGTALGVGSAWLLTGAVATPTQPLDFTVPFGQVGAMVAVAAVAAVLAALVPARRAARTALVAGLGDG